MILSECTKIKFLPQFALLFIIVSNLYDFISPKKTKVKMLSFLLK